MIISILLMIGRGFFVVFSLRPLDKFPGDFCIRLTLAIIWL